jgi:lipoyl(octanoyl) transferase
MEPAELHVRRLGRADYQPVWRAMQAFTDARDETTADELWVVEHPPVFTQGQAGKAEHILDAGDIPVIQVDRGGQVTYHGPGQIVMYPLLDIKRLGLGVKALVAGIEQAIIDVLATYGITAGRLENAPGVYVDGVKIASLGLRIRKGRSFHGLAFNVDMDLEPFTRINPCGFQNLRVTSLSSLVGSVDMEQVECQLLTRLAAALGYNNGFRVVAGRLPGDAG